MGLLTFTALLVLSQSPAEALRDETETKVRAELATLLTDLCSGKCFVLSVTAKVEERAEKPPEPGFEQVTEPKKVAVLRSLNAAVLADDKLPDSFRARLRTLVTQRLKGFTPNVTVSLETVALPAPEPKEVLAPTPLTPPPPVVTAPPPVAEPELSLKDKILRKLVDDAATVAVAVLLAIAAIICASMLRRSARGEAKPTLLPETLPSSKAASSEPMRSVDAALRRAVLRDAAQQGEWSLLGQWLSALGAEAAADLRGQLDAEGQLSLEAALQSAGAPDSQAMAAFDQRLARASLRRTDDPVERAFAFIADSDPRLFAECARRLSKDSLQLALRFAPARHRRAVTDALSDSERSRLAESWASAPLVQLEQARQAASELSALLGNIGGLVATDAALSDLLYAMPTAEQRKLVASLGSAASAVADHSELLVERAAPEVLAAAVATLPAARMASYLAGAEQQTQARVLGVCSAALKTELERALQGASSEQFFAARAELIGRVRVAMKQQRGGAA